MANTALDTALTALDNALASGTDAPRTDLEAAEAFGVALGNALRMPASTRVYVPDAESPVTVADKDAQISGPMLNFDPEIRALSLRAKNAISGLTSLVREYNAIQAGLSSQIQSAGAKVAAAQSLVASSQLAWMSYTDRLLDFSGFDPGLSNGVVLSADTGNGVSLAPSSEQDLTGIIGTITLVQNLSPNGLPGDNVELAAIQGTPATNSPAAGSSSALSSTQATVSSSGGTGQEPTVSFAGDPDLHNSLSALTDSSGQSWFDFERVFVPPVQPCTLHGTAYVADPSGGQATDVESVTLGYGWTANVTYPDGTSAVKNLVRFLSTPPVPGHDGASSTLILSLEIDFGQPVPINELTVTVLQEGGIWANIDGIEVSLDHNAWLPMTTQSGALAWQGDAAASQYNQSLVNSGGSTAAANGGSLRGGSVWQLTSIPQTLTGGQPPEYQYIAITFSQPDSYVCPKGIGHPYYVGVQSTTTSSQSFFGLFHNQSQATTVTRYATPDQVVSLQAGTSATTTSQNGGSLGNLLGQAAQIAVPLATGGIAGQTIAAAGGVGSLVSGLVNGLLGSKKTTTQILQAGEYTDVFAASRQSISIGRIQPSAVTYATGTPGQFVSLPITFASPFTAVRMIADDSVPGGTTVVYEISVDNGTTWQAITPSDVGQPPAPSSAQTGYNVLAFPSAQQSCRVRATFATTAVHTTPRLLGYTLQALP